MARARIKKDIQTDRPGLAARHVSGADQHMITVTLDIPNRHQQLRELIEIDAVVVMVTVTVRIAEWWRPRERDEK